MEKIRAKNCLITSLDGIQASGNELNLRLFSWGEQVYPMRPNEIQGWFNVKLSPKKRTSRAVVFKNCLDFVDISFQGYRSPLQYQLS